MNLFEALRVLNLTSTRVLVAGSSTEYGHTTSFWKGPVPETAPLLPVCVQIRLAYPSLEVLSVCGVSKNERKAWGSLTLLLRPC